MKRYKRKLEEMDLDNSKETREMLIKMMADNYADWMATANSAYLGHEHAFNLMKKEFMKQGIMIAKQTAKMAKTNNELYNIKEDAIDKVIRLKGKLK